MKKCISVCLIAVIIICNIFTGSVNAVYAEEEFSLEKYIADLWTDEGGISNYIACMLEKDLVTKAGITDPLDHHAAFQGAVVVWEGTHVILDPSELLKGAIDAKGYYQAVLFSLFLEQQNDAKNVLDKTCSVWEVSEDILSGLGEWVKTTSGINYAGDLKQLKHMDLPKEKLEKFLEGEFVKRHPGLSLTMEAGKGIDAALKVTELVTDLVVTLEAYFQMVELSESTKAVIQEMYDNCPESNGLLREALHDIIIAMSNYEVAIGTAMYNTGVEGLTGVIEEGIEKIWTAAVSKSSYASCFMSGLQIGNKLGTGICNALFSTDDSVEQYYKLKVLNKTYDVLRTTVVSMEEAYLNDRTVENAENYISAVTTLIEIRTLSCDFALGLADILYNETRVEWLKVSGESYDSYVEAYNELKAEYLKGQRIMWDISYNQLYIDHPDIYISLFLNTSKEIPEGTKYLYFDEGLSWYEAQEKCEELGGHLLVISSEAEQEYINQYLENLCETGGMTKQNIWLGATMVNSVPKWVTGEEMMYTYWNTGEPNNEHGIEDCVMLYTPLSQKGPSGYWNDECGNGREDDSGYRIIDFGYICEWEAEANITVESTENGIARADKTKALEGEMVVVEAIAKAGYQFKEWIAEGGVVLFADTECSVTSFVMPETDVTIKAVFEKAKYQYFDEGLSWYEAQEKCEELGGHLLVISSEEEQKYINEYLEELRARGNMTKQNIWLGANMIGNALSWVTGENVTYTAWNSGEPNNVLGEQDCVMLYTALTENGQAGYWNDESGNGRDWSGFRLHNFGYICEWETAPASRKEIEACLYNGEYYALANEDVAVALNYDPDKLYEHWINYGKAEGRSASLVFHAAYYLEVNSDVAAVVGEDYEAAYEHFVTSGLLEGRESSPVFDVKYYLQANSDVAEAFNYDYVKVANHFNTNALAEGRSGSGNFDYTVYRYCNTDVADLYGEEIRGYYIHYINHGRAEGRTAGFGTNEEIVIDTNAVSYRIFDKDYYLENYPELAGTVGTIEEVLYRYWLSEGMGLGHVASPVFNPTEYLSINTDVAEAVGNDLEAATHHFLNYGIYEGRTGVMEFDYTVYKYCNTDVVDVFGEDIVGYYFHYVKYGRAEGRTAKLS